jgi:hypothetical protein
MSFLPDNIRDSHRKTSIVLQENKDVEINNAPRKKVKIEEIDAGNYSKATKEWDWKR